AVVADAVNRAGVIVRHQQRAVLEHLHVYRAADIVVVLQEAGHERLPGFHAAIGVELHGNDIAAELGGLVPRAVAGDEDRVAIGSRKHLASVKAHAERGRVRAEQRNGRLEVAAAAPPAKLVVGHIALVAIGIAEMLPGLGDAVELVVGQILRQPIAAVVGEIELLRYGVEIKPDRVANSAHVGFRSAAVEIHAPDLSVGLGRKADVTGRSDVDVELVVERAFGTPLMNTSILNLLGSLSCGTGNLSAAMGKGGGLMPRSLVAASEVGWLGVGGGGVGVDCWAAAGKAASALASVTAS